MLATDDWVIPCEIKDDCDVRKPAGSGLHW